MMTEIREYTPRHLSQSNHHTSLKPLIGLSSSLTGAGSRMRPTYFWIKGTAHLTSSAAVPCRPFQRSNKIKSRKSPIVQ